MHPAVAGLLLCAKFRQVHIMRASQIIGAIFLLSAAVNCAETPRYKTNNAVDGAEPTPETNCAIGLDPNQDPYIVPEQYTQNLPVFGDTFYYTHQSTTDFQGQQESTQIIRVQPDTDQRTVVVEVPTNSYAIAASGNALLWLETHDRSGQTCTLHHTEGQNTTLLDENLPCFPHLSPFNGGQAHQLLSPGHAVWLNQGEVRQFKNGAVQTVAQTEENAFYLLANDEYIAWFAPQNRGGELWLWSAEQIRSVRIENNSAPRPGLMHHALVWIDDEGNIAQLNFETGQTTLVFESNCYSLTAQGDAVFLCNDNPAEPSQRDQFYHYDGQSITNLNTPGKTISFVAVNQNYVAWIDYDEGDDCANPQSGMLRAYTDHNTTPLAIASIAGDCQCCGALPRPSQIQVSPQGIFWSHARDETQPNPNPYAIGFTPFVLSDTCAP